MTTEPPITSSGVPYNPKKEFVAWVLIHLIAWSLLPWLVNSCLHLDTIEALLWGKEWEWGYNKHPPLSAWAAEIFGKLFGDWGLYFLSQLCIVIGGLGIWKLGRELGLKSQACFMGVIFLDAIYYYQHISPEFNVNYLQLPFWAWGWWAGLRGARTGKLIYWISLGLAVGLGALTKYFAVVLVIPLLLALAERGELWQQLRKPGLYLAGMVSILVFLPHLLWMRENDWITITYGLKRAEGSDLSFLAKRLLYPLEFIGSQFAIILPLLIFAFLSRAKKRSEVRQEEKGLRSFAWAGFGLIFFLSLFFGWRPVTMWAVPMPLALGLWAASWMDATKFKRTALASLSFGMIGLIAYVIAFGFGPVIRSKPHRTNYPGHELASQVEAAWLKEQNTPLKYIISDEFLGGLVSWYGANRASVMIQGSLENSTYLSDADIKQHGAIVLWMKNRESTIEQVTTLDAAYPDLRDRFSSIIEKADLVIPWPNRKDEKHGRYGFAMIKPEQR